jgi:esterase/lipase superfamily enzyme
MSPEMNIEYHRFWSKALDQDMEFKIYGHAGKPVVVFPSQSSGFYQYEDFSMVWACSLYRRRINCSSGQYRDQSWANWNAQRTIGPGGITSTTSTSWKNSPFIRVFCTKGRFLATVAAWAATMRQFFFPRISSMSDPLSGIFRLNMFVGDYMDENVYFNSPLVYLPNLSDPWYLEQFRESHIIVCAGMGAWEEEMIADALALKQILDDKGVPCWIDLWGQDVNHDWPWWRKQMPYFLGHLNL